jgi:hypothetical protein
VFGPGIWSTVKTRAGALWSGAGSLGKLGIGALGVGAAAGMLNPNRTTFGGAATTVKGGVSGAWTGALVGSISGALGSAWQNRGLGLTRAMAGSTLIGAGTWGAMGAVGGALIGGGFGILKAGCTSNRPVNRIRGLHQ